jgi:cyclic pyranopterin phosphate synthase
VSADHRPESGVFEDGSRAARRKGGHVDRAARPHMADVSGRPAVLRRAAAEAEVVVSHETLSAIIDGATPRGDVLGVAELAGVMAAKRASELIPLCRNVTLTELLVRATPERASGLVRIRAEAGAIAQGGVEMEALTGAAIAALTLYDMIRDIDRSASVGGVRLVSTWEGPEEAWHRPEEAAVRRHAPAGARAAGRISGQRGRQSQRR